MSFIKSFPKYICSRESSTNLERLWLVVDLLGLLSVHQVTVSLLHVLLLLTQDPLTLRCFLRYSCRGVQKRFLINFLVFVRQFIRPSTQSSNCTSSQLVRQVCSQVSTGGWFETLSTRPGYSPIG